jgi:TolA-binding protein
MYDRTLKTTIIGSLLVGLSLGAACVYYNTFYHAEEYYKEGLREIEKSDGLVTKKAKDDFQKSIQKCVKVLTTYPNSSHVDDALLLMGKAFYQKNEFEEAIKTLDKLLVEHPDSDKKDEALYWKAKAEFQEGLYNECLLTIDQTIGRKVKNEWIDELSFLRGETHFVMENYPASYEEFRQLMNRKSDTKWRDEGLLRMAQCQFYMENYDEALEKFQELVAAASTLSLKREGYFWIASSFSEIGRYQDAADAYIELLAGELTDEEIIRARIGLGRQFILLDRIDDALEIFELITFDYSKTAEAAEANYRRGKLYLEVLQDSERAREEFKKGYRNAPNSEYGKLCEEKWSEVERLRKLREFIDEKDLQSIDELAQAHFLVAEFYYYQLADPEQALSGFQTVIDSFPDSPWAPKASFTRAWIFEKEVGDSIASRQAYQMLIDRYPDTRYADFARMEMDVELPERPIAFYEDELEGKLLGAVAVDGSNLLIDEPSVVESQTDSISGAAADSLVPEESTEGDTLSGG